MLKYKLSFILLIIGLLLFPAGFCQALWNTYTWGTQTRLYFSNVAAEAGGEKGISIDVSADSFLHSYEIDVDKLKVEMRAGSHLHLKSENRKIFTTDIETAETVCGDEYSTWDYSTPTTTKTIYISFADDNNCPAIETDPPVQEEEEEETGQVIDLYNLTEEVIQTGLAENDRVSFIINNIMEIMTIESISSTKATVNLSKLNKTFYLKLNKRQNMDIDADDYRDVKLTLKEISAGKANISFKPIEVVKIDNLSPGSLIKATNSSAVYYLAEDSQRYVFPNEKVYYSWYENFDNVITISDENMARLPLGGLATYRPGIKMVTFTSSADVYVIAQGGVLKKLKDEAMAIEFYGKDWNKQIHDINDAFACSYSFGNDLINSSEYNKDAQTTLNPTITVDKDI